MVVEFADTDTQAVKPWEREIFCQSKITPPNWFVWIGKYDGINLHYAFRHGTLAFGQNRPKNNIPFDTQITTFAIGELLLHTASTTFPSCRAVLDRFDYPPGFNLIKIAPFQDGIRAGGPVIAMTDQIVDPFCEFLRATLKAAILR